MHRGNGFNELIYLRADRAALKVDIRVPLKIKCLPASSGEDVQSFDPNLDKVPFPLKA